MSDVFCVLAEFDSPQSLYHAAEHVRDSEYTAFDVYTPFPVHGMDQAMGLKESRLAPIVFMGGSLGLIFGISYQSWASTFGYSLVISGKPLLSFPAFVPVSFELMILFSAFATVFGMFGLNKIPRHSHPLLKNDRFRTATSHGFFLAIEASDPHFDADKIEAFLTKIGATSVEKVEG